MSVGLRRTSSGDVSEVPRRKTSPLFARTSSSGDEPGANHSITLQRTSSGGAVSSKRGGTAIRYKGSASARWVMSFHAAIVRLSERKEGRKEGGMENLREEGREEGGGRTEKGRGR